VSICNKSNVCLVISRKIEQKILLICKIIRNILKSEKDCQRVCKQLFSEKISNCFFISCQQNYKISDLAGLENQISLLVQNDEPFIFIIYDVDKMGPAVANRLLKKLEEPPTNIHFILTASNESLILNTIKSRCNQVIINQITEKIDISDENRLVNFFTKDLSFDQINDLDQILKEEIFDEQSCKQTLEQIIFHTSKSNMNLKKTRILASTLDLIPQSGFQNFWRYLFLQLT